MVRCFKMCEWQLHFVYVRRALALPEPAGLSLDQHPQHPSPGHLRQRRTRRRRVANVHAATAWAATAMRTGQAASPELQRHVRQTHQSKLISDLRDGYARRRRRRRRQECAAWAMYKWPAHPPGTTQSLASGWRWNGTAWHLECYRLSSLVGRLSAMGSRSGVGHGLAHWVGSLVRKCVGGSMANATEDITCERSGQG